MRASKIGCRCGISEPKPSLTLVVAAPSVARTTNGSMKVLSVPSIPWGWNTKWSDRKSTRLNSSHSQISYAVFCLKKKKNKRQNSCVQNAINKNATLAARECTYDEHNFGEMTNNIRMYRTRDTTRLAQHSGTVYAR